MTFLQNKIIIGLLSAILLGVGILIFRTQSTPPIDNQQWKIGGDDGTSAALNKLSQKRSW